MTLVEAAAGHQRVENARVALREARYDAALSGLAGCEDWPLEVAQYAVLVKADTLTRRDAATALAWLANTNDIVDAPEARFEREILTGKTFANARNFGAAAARFERARTYVDHVPNGESRLAYQSARLRWFRRQLEPTDPDLSLALLYSDPTHVASVYSIRSWAQAYAGNYRAQVRDLILAIDVAADVGYRCDVGVMGIVVATLARIAFEIADVDAIAIARIAFESIAWTDDVRVDKFQIERALGFDAFMRGDVARAQWLFRDATVTAPTPAFATLAHLDRAYVARSVRNEPWALDELYAAQRLAEDVKWGQTFGEERIALVMLAVMLAPVDTAKAQRFAAIYSRLGVENVDPRFALSGEPRALAAESYALALIEQMLGHADSALESLRAAYDVYAPIEHHYRALTVATTIGEITGDAIWMQRVRAHVAHYPGSPLADRTLETSIANDSVLDVLSPLARQVARAHWSGASASELSKRFSRSLYTIERQIALIYAAFGVTSEGALRAEAMRRGLA